MFLYSRRTYGSRLLNKMSTSLFRMFVTRETVSSEWFSKVFFSSSTPSIRVMVPGPAIRPKQLSPALKVWWSSCSKLIKVWIMTLKGIFRFSKLLLGGTLDLYYKIPESRKNTWKISTRFSGLASQCHALSRCPIVRFPSGRVSQCPGVQMSKCPSVPVSH